MGLLFSRTDSVMLGDKPAKVGKLTPAKFRKLNEVTNVIPLLAMHIFTAMKSEDPATYMLAVVNEFMSEVVKVVAVLSEIDEKYIDENASLTQITNYLVEMIKHNDFSTALKNVKSLLSK
mgnify:FL=1